MSAADLASLPALDDRFELDPAAVDGFARDGHALVRGLASPEEAAAYQPIIEEAALATAWDTRPIGERDTYGKAFLQSFNLWRVDERIARFVLARRFAGVAAALLGVERVRLYHDQALCKEPGGGRTPWHQDRFYWPVDCAGTITMWMPLVRVPAEVGSMTFVSGSHLLGDLQGTAISDRSDELLGRLVEERGLPTRTYGAMAPGDATFHAGWTVHSAGPNPTDQLRTVMTVIYLADPARVASVVAPGQELDHQVWLHGAEPGTPIDDPRNPVLG